MPYLREYAYICSPNSTWKVLINKKNKILN